MKTEVREGRPARRKEVWVRQAGKENAVFDPRNGALHFLNETALAIWDLCDGDTWPEEMIDAVCLVSGLPREVVEEDVGRILHQFDHAGLIDWVE